MPQIFQFFQVKHLIGSICWAMKIIFHYFSRI